MRFLYRLRSSAILLILMSFMPGKILAANITQYKVFVYPKYQNHHLDWCYKWGEGCGRTTAFVYCKQLGFRGVHDYRIAHDIGLTKVMSTGQICRYPHCDSFKWIRCFR